MAEIRGPFWPNCLCFIACTTLIANGRSNCHSYMADNIHLLRWFAQASHNAFF